MLYDVQYNINKADLKVDKKPDYPPSNYIPETTTSVTKTLKQTWSVKPNEQLREKVMHEILNYDTDM